MEQVVGQRRRRVHSAEFKFEAVAACRKPGAPIAAAALERSINANLLRRWVVEAERAEGGRSSAPKALPAPSEAFIALAVQRGQPTAATLYAHLLGAYASIGLHC
jgi:transposase